MRHFRLLSVMCIMLMTSIGTKAQILTNNEKPEVLLINGNGTKLDAEISDRVISTYYSTVEKGFRQVGVPRFIMTGKNQKMILGIGGNVAIRTSYDFGGIANSLDFITYDIPVPNSDKERQQFQIDPSTSTLFFKAIANGGKLGPIEAFIQTDFRGYQNSNLYLRQAYIKIKGLLVGRNFTTFADLNSSPNTVDFEGPNYIPFIYNTMIRYVQPIGKHWSVAAALEMPNVSATTGNNISTIPQRMPDIPVYVQYSWNNKQSHIRASAVFRDMMYYNDIENQRESEFGWGTQLSGNIQMGKKFTVYFGGVYGEGISAYIQDISGNGLDLVTDANNPTHLQTLPMAGWTGGMQYMFNSKWAATAVYGGVKVFTRDGFNIPSTYNLAQYVSTNLFYNITPYLQSGISYMYGSRKNIDSQLGHANRIQAIMQYNF